MLAVEFATIEQGEMRDVNASIEKLHELDLKKIYLNLTDTLDGPGWTQEKCEEVEGIYRLMLLSTMVDPDTIVAPSKDVDTFWHYHILDTRKYAQDCTSLVGGMIHHDPYLGMEGDESVRDLRGAWTATRSIVDRLGLTREQLEALCFKPNVDNVVAFCGMSQLAAFCGMSSEEKAAFCGSIVVAAAKV